MNIGGSNGGEKSNAWLDVVSPNNGKVASTSCIGPT